MPVVSLCQLHAQRSPNDSQEARAGGSKPVPKTEPANVTCPEQLGTGVRTKADFCFVLAGRDPADGVLVSIPPHSQATLTFDLHNRHTYSEEEIRAGRGFAKYTAVIGVLSMTGDLLGRGAVQTEFRTAKDLYDRITGGAGPGGTKAVAPLGREQVSITYPGRRRPGESARRSARSHDRRRTRSRHARPAGRDRQQRPGHLPARSAAAQTLSRAALNVHDSVHEL